MSNGFCNIAIKSAKYTKEKHEGLTSTGKHLLRLTAEDYGLADPSKTKENKVLIKMDGKTLAQSLNKFLKKHNLETRNTQTVQAYQVVFSIPSTHKDNQKLVDEWEKSTLDFINTHPIFKDNCLLLVHHKDEKQNHIQGIFVPRVHSTNTLNFTELLGGKLGIGSRKLSALHDAYSSKLKPLGFQRGDGTNTNGLEHKRYMSLITKTNAPIPPPAKLITVPEVSMFNKSEVIKTLQKNLATVKKENLRLRTKWETSDYCEARFKGKQKEYVKYKRIAMNLAEEKEREKMKLKDEQTEALRQIPCVEVLEKLGFEVKSEGTTSRLKNDNLNLVINHENKFTENKSGVGGFGAISLLTQVFKYSFRESISFLSTHFSSEKIAKVIAVDKVQSEKMIQQAVKTAALKIPESKPVNLNKVIDYLINRRKLSKTLIDDLIKQNRLFADSKNNCIFPNKENTTAFIRGTYQPIPPKPTFKAVAGKADFIKFDFGNNKEKYIFESVIDALSYRTLNPTKDGEYIVTNGAMMINRVHEAIATDTTKVNLCFDKDPTGKSFCDTVLKQLVCKVEILQPTSKDFNEDLTNGYNNPGPTIAERDKPINPGNTEIRPRASGEKEEVNSVAAIRNRKINI